MTQKSRKEQAKKGKIQLKSKISFQPVLSYIFINHLYINKIQNQKGTFQKVTPLFHKKT